MRAGVGACVVALLFAASAIAAELMADDDIGTFRVYQVLDGKTALADPQGRIVYTFAGDADGKPNCTGACATQWPPLLRQAGEPNGMGFATVARDDGQLQWTYRGKPLYRSSRDTEPGQANGHGVDDAWFIVVVAGHEM